MILSAPAIVLTAAVTVLAALVCLGVMFLAAVTRSKYKVEPPAMTGALQVECALRVQGNTTEQIVIFLPLLWVAALYFQGWWAPILGLVWCLGRVIYAVGYMKAPGSPQRRLCHRLHRHPGIAGLGHHRPRPCLDGDKRSLTLHDLIDFHQLFQQRRKVAQPDHVGAIAGRVVRVLMHFHEDAGHARRHRGRAPGTAPCCGRRPMWCPARPGCCTLCVASKHHRRAKAGHDRQGPHVADQRVVAEADAAFRSPAHWGCRRR